MLKIFYAPREAFEALRARPRWLLPLGIVAAFSVVAVVLLVYFRVGFAEQMARIQEMIDQGKIPPEAMARVEQFQSGPRPVVTYLLPPISSIIALAVQVAIMSAILLLVTPVLGGETSFALCVALVSTAALVRIPGLVLRTIVMFLRSSMHVYSSIALLFPFLKPGGFLHAFLSRLDFFVVWELVLVAMGLNLVNRVEKKKAYFFVFGLWLVYVLLTSLIRFGQLGMA